MLAVSFFFTFTPETGEASSELRLAFLLRKALAVVLRSLVSRARVRRSEAAARRKGRPSSAVCRREEVATLQIPALDLDMKGGAAANAIRHEGKFP